MIIIISNKHLPPWTRWAIIESHSNINSKFQQIRNKKISSFFVCQPTQNITNHAHLRTTWCDDFTNTFHLFPAIQNTPTWSTLQRSVEAGVEAEEVQVRRTWKPLSLLWSKSLCWFWHFSYFVNFGCFQIEGHFLIWQFKEKQLFI